MKRYRISGDAARDLDAIFVDWAERAGLEVADRLITSITGRFWVLGEYLESGRRAAEMALGVRCFPAGKYLIYYRRVRGGVEILHVFHGAKNQRAAWRK